jgi:hypothetical protein
LALQIQPASVVDNAIQDSIAEGRVWETHKAICHGDLSSDQGGDAAITIDSDPWHLLIPVWSKKRTPCFGLSGRHILDSLVAFDRITQFAAFESA